MLPKTEVMQLELIAGLACPSFLQVPHDHVLLCAALSAHGHWVPQLRQQALQVAGEPVTLGVGVFECHENIAQWHDCAFGHCFDHDRQLAFVLLQDVLPTVAIEESFVVGELLPGKVVSEKTLRRKYLLDGDHLPDEVLLQVVLQPEEDHLATPAPRTLEVGVDRFRARRVLEMARDLARVREQDDVVKHVHPIGTSDGKQRRHLQSAALAP
mmetsp:Transcript_118352/g.342151  ORF Transcript_118352/g.342151 Transcript_118352/m.342151 type:complete len:212 (-) Transcript_118352:1091-1726(-)